MGVAWAETVRLVGRDGKVWVVATNEDAYELLTRYWPRSDGEAFFVALDVCGKPTDGTLHNQLSRFAFLRAANEADVVMRQLTDECDDQSVSEMERRIAEDR